MTEHMSISDLAIAHVEMVGELVEALECVDAVLNDGLLVELVYGIGHDLALASSVELARRKVRDALSAVATQNQETT